MTYEQLLIEAENNDKRLKIKEGSLRKFGLSGICKNNKIAIEKTLNLREKNCILSEELGHYCTTYGNIIDQTDIKNIQQEKKARNWGYEKLVGIVDLINCFNKGIRSKHEIAEYLDVTEEFLGQAIQHYREKYGICYEIDNYLVYFEPNLIILKML
jgi:hypothetical protein